MALTPEAMAITAVDAPCLLGPVAFKDVNMEEEEQVISPAEEFADIISTMPSITTAGVGLRRYQDVWLLDDLVPGCISLQRRFKARPGDVLLASPPKCGTTWLKGLSFATMARAAHPPSEADHPLLRLNPHECVPFMEEQFSAGQEAKLEALPSPRLLHTHMHYSMLPSSLSDNPDCKIIFVCREPKDMLVSLWYFIKGRGGYIPFSDLLELACEGKHAYGPIWDHLLGYWTASRASPDRVLFLKYEQMLADPIATIQELARFLGVPFTAEEEVAGLPLAISRMCSIDTMRDLKANKTGNTGMFMKIPHQIFFRKGVVGDWVNHMTPEMARRIDAIVENKLQGSGLTFTP